MTADAVIDSFDSRGFHDKPLKSYLVRSAVFHGILLTIVLTWGIWQGEQEQFGSQDAGGASVGINVVDTIPLPSRGQPNPLANDTKSIAPQAPPEPVAEPEPIPEPAKPEIEIEKPIKEKVTQQEAASKTQRFRSYDELAANQLTSKTAPQAADQMFSQAAGADQIGIGENTTLGDRFGGYAAQVRDRVARNWRTQTLAAGLTSAPPAVARFQIQRNGQATNFQLLQSSGNTALDLTIQRAILDSSPFPRLPLGYEGNSATVEFVFELKK